MHARVSTYQLQPDSIDAAVDRFNDALSDPDLRPEEAVLLVDRSSGKAITVTFWQDEEAAVASREAANRLRESAATSAAGTVESVEEFEVALKQ